MFTMMNAARLAVGVQGLAAAEAAYQEARAYALERLQGRSLAGPMRLTAGRPDHRSPRRAPEPAHHQGLHGRRARSRLLGRPPLDRNAIPDPAERQAADDLAA